MTINEWVPMDTDDYTVGTVTLTAGSSDIVFNNAFNGAEASFYAGDSIYIPTVGKWLLLASIGSRTIGTLLYPCPSDCAGTFNLRLRPLARNARQAGLATLVLRNLQTGNLPSLADVKAEKGQILQAGEVQGEWNAVNFDVLTYMKKEIYDPNEVASDAFSMGNMVETDTAKILSSSEREILNNLEQTLNRLRIPVGLESYIDSELPPDGWLAANGNRYNISAYPDLAKFCGVKYGGDGITTFAVPDRRGLFIRGWDNGRGIDTGRQLGSDQGDAIRNITGSVNDDSMGYLGRGSGAINSHNKANTSPGGTWSTSGRQFGFSFDASRVVPTAPENRPRNVALLPIIKY
ncbi:phage tail protein [Bartonella tamiae]|uniref:Phage tail collar domain-containing protein n=1 Tax=Bartonella tamiae Th239 TaxID=1094558 RepID=J1K3I4_9HYPH|nr:phage tail protein [Bartonella tamiae]EJF91695.1 hypothetical protein ME5_00074 [Bartonella tamiae Th239]